MQLALFITFLTLSLALISLGYYSKEGSYALIGSAMLAFIGATVLITGNVQYVSGETVFTNNTIGANNTITSTLATHTDVYSSFTGTQSRTLGFWIALLGIVTFAVTMFELDTPTLRKADIMP